MMNKKSIRRALIRLRLRQRRPVAPLPVVDTQHTCQHCGYQYVGRQCPQCGMPGGGTRFTAKKLFYGFLDIWGLGNRPMFRSMGHLLWRPGYMIRDYLGGHYLSYFPPFKMLAVTTVLVAFTVWLLGIDTSNVTNVTANIVEAVEEAVEKKAVSAAVLQGYRQASDILLGNTLYRLLLQIVMLVFAVWLVFRKRGLNLVETFFAMVYISCQMQLVTIAWLLLTRRLLPVGGLPYALPYWVMLPLLVFDFHQLYNLKLWGAVWRMLLVILLVGILYAVVVVALIGILFLALAAENKLL